MHIAELLKEICKIENMPKNWRKAIMSPIYKNRDNMDYKNYTMCFIDDASCHL